MKSLVAIFGSILILSFSKSDNSNNPFFEEYDQVLCFTYEIAEKDASRAFTTNGYNGEPRVLFEDLPDKVSNTIVSDLFHQGFKRREIKKDMFPLLDEIFSAKPVDHFVLPECLVVYRDILIFRRKKSKQIKGIAQLCFECGRSRIILSEKETKGFGQHDEFRKLKELKK